MPVEAFFFKAGKLDPEPKRMHVPADAADLTLLERAVRAELQVPADMTRLVACCGMPGNRFVEMDSHTRFDNSNLVQMVFGEPNVSVFA